MSGTRAGARSFATPRAAAPGPDGRSVNVLHIQKVAGLAGSEKHLLTLLPRLGEHGVRPEMLVLADSDDRPEPFVERMQAGGVPTRVIPMHGDADPLLAFRVRAEVRRGRYHLVHTHLLHADLYGRLGARLAGVRVVSSYHCDDPLHLIPGVRQMDAVSARACSRIICISGAVRDFVHREIGVPERLLTVVRYGMDPEPAGPGRDALRAELGIAPGDPVVGIVGRLHDQKGHVYLFQAFRRVLAAHPRALLVVAGDGPEREALDRLAGELGIAERTRFLGFRADAPALMHAFDVVAVPSLYEGFGLVLLEAMAAARPLVASSVSAIPEIVVEGETGLLAPPRDPHALAAALTALLDDPARAARMGAAGRARLLTEFTVERMVEATARVYRSVADPLRAN